MVMGLIIGFGVGVVLLSALLVVAVQRTRRQSADRLAAQQATIADLRLELADDKENNRRLRHEVHALSSSISGSAPPAGPNDFDAVDEKIGLLIGERDEARRELAETRMALESTRARLDDREAKLSEYRAAVQEIRLSLEGQDSLRNLVTVTQDVPESTSANAPGGE
jgi:chromosome segregation ATPase